MLILFSSISAFADDYTLPDVAPEHIGTYVPVQMEIQLKRTKLFYDALRTGYFFTRFCLEFIKLDQEAFEANMFLNMGQWLSLPFIIWGIWLIVKAMKNPPVEGIPNYHPVTKKK